jgi:DNA-binding CsgD family transcriptional regulator
MLLAPLGLPERECHTRHEIMSAEIVGRERELAAVHAFLNGPAARPAGLVLEGDPGIGKSTVWAAAVSAAAERGLRVLRSRPAEAERGLAYAGLGDLFDGVLDEVLPALPLPRRAALEAALLLAEAEGPVDPRTLAVAVRNALALLARERPVVVAVDDVQWLDPSSSAAVAFALRRLEDERVLVLLTRRLAVGIEPSELEAALDAERVRLGPLSMGAIGALLRARLGRALPRPALLRVHETSGGNPFYALELARTLSTVVDPTQPLPVPETLEALVRARLAGLPEQAQEALGLVAAAGRPSVALLERAGVDEEALAAALDAHVLENVDGVLRFTHPLLGSVLEGGQSPRRRRRLHAVLADVVEDPAARARHLALAAAGPDAATAAHLDEAATAASARGAPLAAAELAEHALRLTPPEDGEEAHARTIRAGHAHLAAGSHERARVLARTLLAQAPRGRRRAEATLLLADVWHDLQHDMSRWLASFREALHEAGDDPALAGRIHERAAWPALFTEGGAAAELHARAALELAERRGDDAAAAWALGALAVVRHGVGEPDAVVLAEEARRRGRASGDAETAFQAEKNRAHVLLQTGHFEAGRVALEELESEWVDRSETALEAVLVGRSILELHAGEFRVGAAYAERRRELAVQHGWDDPVWLWDVAAHAVQRGDHETARSIAELGRLRPVDPRAASLAVLGLSELTCGDAKTAVARFAEAERVRAGGGIREPHLYWWRGDYAEGLLELGRIEEAVALLDAWEAEAVRLGRERILAQIARCRGQVAAARGEVGEAIALLEEAARRHEALGDRYQRGRALLALGGVRRRARQKRAAREAIEQALALFEGCGSEVFAARARAELGSIGGRRREEGLTSAERRVAELAAEGKTNREVAAALFLGESTVRTHLSHVYAKLGVRSRTELARTLRPSKVQQS